MTRFKPVRITNIQRRPCTTPVYNLAVEGDESYVANDVVVHNCRSMLVPITLDVPIDSDDLVTEQDADTAHELAGEGFGGDAREGAEVKPSNEDLAEMLADTITRIEREDGFFADDDEKEEWLDQAKELLRSKTFAFDPDQPRDEDGQWASISGGPEGGGSSSEHSWLKELIPYGSYRDKITNDPVLNDFALKHKLEEHEAVALYAYTHGKAKAINGTLRAAETSQREEDQLDDEHMRYVELVDKALAKLPVHSGEVVYRGYSTRDEERLRFIMANTREGDEITEVAFLSTSTSKSVGEGFAEARGGDFEFLYSIKHKSGREVDRMSKYLEESEVLFPRNTTFRVNKVSKKGSRVNVEMEEV